MVRGHRSDAPLQPPDNPAEGDALHTIGDNEEGMEENEEGMEEGIADLSLCDASFSAKDSVPTSDHDRISRCTEGVRYSKFDLNLRELRFENPFLRLSTF